jgi:hypothetical protein
MHFLRSLFLVLFSLISIQAYAESLCSPYIGLATLNEVSIDKTGNTADGAMLEIKLLDPSLTADDDYDGWTVKICTRSNNCEVIPVSRLTDVTAPWLYEISLAGNESFPISLVDFSNGFDLSLLDSNNDFIDYIQVNNDDNQDFNIDNDEALPNCSYNDLAYVYTVPGTARGTKILRRVDPDGTGPWERVNAESEDHTPGNGNDGDFPYLVVDTTNATVAQGETAVFTVSLIDAITHEAYITPVEVSFRVITLDATALSPTHYQGFALQDIIIEAGNSASDPIEIATQYIGDSQERFFYLYIQSASAASVLYPLVKGTITGVEAAPEFSCEATFVDGATSHSVTGSVNFGSYSYLYQGADSELASSMVNNSGNLSCQDSRTECTASGTATAAINLPSFETTNSSSTLTVGIGLSETIGESGDNEYETITVNGTLTTANIQTSYKITNFIISAHGHVYLAPGEYWVENFTVASSARIYLTEPGTVTFYVKNDFTLGSNSHVNNISSEEYRLLLVGYSDITLGGSIQIEALLYAQGSISTQGFSTIKGALSGDIVTFSGRDKITYQCNLDVDPVIDHYEIIHDGSGLTCDAETVTINACTNSAGEICQPTTNTSVVLDLVVKNAAGTELTRTSGINFSDTGSASFNYTEEGSVYLSLENASPTATEPFVCNDGGTDSCKMDFAKAGFIFSGINSIEVAGVPFNNVTIQAVEDVDGVCSGLFNGEKSVDFAMEYTSPDTVTDKEYSIGDEFIGKNRSGQLDNYSAITVDFGNDGNSLATLDANTYFDAGNIRLNARYTEPASGGSNEFTLVGSSSFTVRPYEFIITATNSEDELLNGTTDNAAVTQKAGQDFLLEIEAVNKDGDRTTNYTWKVVHFALQRTGPVLTGVEGSLRYGGVFPLNSSLTADDYNFAFIIMMDGVHTFNSATYDEVGLLNLTVREFWDNGNRATGSAPIGRFVPDHFSLESSSVVNACVAEDFTYMDDPALALNYEVEARNAANRVTKNYLEDDEHNFIHASVELVAENNNTSELSERLSGYQGAWSNGVYDSVVANLGGFLRNTDTNDTDGPFDNLIFGLKLIDIDGSTLIDLNMAESLEGDTCDPATTCTAKKLSDSESKLRFGRWLIENTSGSENSVLPQIMKAQYWKSDDDGFVTNTLDSCTTINGDINDKVSDGNLHDAMPALWDYRLIQLSDNSDPIRVTHTNAEMNGLINKFESGVHRGVQFSAPDNIGDLQWELNVPDWMKFDWQDDGDHDENPFATLSFGVYRGNDRIISWREVGN